MNEENDSVTDGGFAFTELSERLASPDGKQIADETRTRLREIHERVAKKLEAGAPADEYEAMRRVSDALVTAEHIMIVIATLREKDVQS